MGSRLNEEETNRSILVKNIPSNATEEQLLNHFQRRKNGGGDVDMVTMEQTAIVTFESPEVSRRVLQVKQELEGGVLQVERIKTEDCCEDEVFSLVTAQIDIRMLQMTIEEACEVMETIHSETGIHWHRAGSALLITGSFTEIQYTRRCVKYLCKGRGPSNLPNELNSRSREQMPVDKGAYWTAAPLGVKNNPTSDTKSVQTQMQGTEYLWKILPGDGYGQAQDLPSNHSGPTKERQGLFSSLNSPEENANSRENRRQSGGASLDVSSWADGQPQGGRSRRKRVSYVNSGGNGLPEAPKSTQHHSSSEDKASCTSPLLYNVPASHGTSVPDRAPDSLSNPASSKRNEGGARRNEGNSEDNRDNECSICLDTIKQPKGLKHCKHKFCKSCIDRALKVNNRCPVCLTPCGILKGNQPPGTMSYRVNISTHLPGFGQQSTIEITYNIPSGTQTAEHPNPGRRYEGTRRMAYLPDTQEGREVLRLLRKAFDARLVFTVGTSATSGLQNQVTWNDIHHKTTTHGGVTGFGYPDPTYLSRVKEELAAKGIK